MAWNPDRRRLVLVTAGVALAALAVVGTWQLRRVLAPQPVQAWAAIEVDGSGFAEIGRVEVPAGTRSTLHAVLEARRSNGEPVYYTAAPGLRIGGREVAAEALLPWDERLPTQVLWFTVEGLRPYVEAEAASTPEPPLFRASFRADWPRAWSVPAVLASSSSSFAQGRELLHEGAFGTQRYHVRIELYESSEALMPTRRFASWAAEELPREEVGFPTLVATLPGPLEPLSRLFGLSQVEPPAGADDLEAATEAWQERDLAFSRVGAIRSLLRAAGVGGEVLTWTEVDLSAGPEWGPGAAAAGDLARVGGRLVVLASDRAPIGRLDREDLCIDLERGIAVRTLGEVFAGDDGLVEWASLPAVGASRWL